MVILSTAIIGMTSQGTRLSLRNAASNTCKCSGVRIMAIHVIDDPDVYLTQSELARYRAEYNQAFSFYAGPPPSFNSWVAQRKAQQTRESDV